MLACWGKRAARGGPLHMCVFRELLLTQTQALHCPSPSPVRMFEGRLIAWLALISAGNKKTKRGLGLRGGTRRGAEPGRLLSKMKVQCIADYS